MNLFSYRGFSPAHEVVLNAECMLNQLINLSNSMGSHVLDTSAQLATVGSDYTCAVEIRTANAAFSEQSTSTEPLEAINDLDQKLRCQMHKWQQAFKVDHVDELHSPFEKQELGFERT